MDEEKLPFIGPSCESLVKPPCLRTEVFEHSVSCVRTVKEVDSRSDFGKIRLQEVKPISKRDNLYKPGSLSFSSVTRPLILNLDRRINTRNKFELRCCLSEQCSDKSVSTTLTSNNGFVNRKLGSLENQINDKDGSKVFKVR